MLVLLLMLPLKCPLMHCTHPLARIGHVCTQALTASHVNKPAPKCLTDTFEMSPSVWLVLPFFWPHSSRCGRTPTCLGNWKLGFKCITNDCQAFADELMGAAIQANSLWCERKWHTASFLFYFFQTGAWKLHSWTFVTGALWSYSSKPVDCRTTKHINAWEEAGDITLELQPIPLMCQSIFSCKHLTSGPQLSALVKPLEIHYTCIPMSWT